MEVVFTPSGLLEVLAEIDQLKDCDIQVSENENGTVTLQIDDAIYTLQGKEENAVEVTEEVLDTIEEINDDGYAEVSDEADDIEPIESGLMQDYARAISLGGFVKMLVDHFKD